MDTSVRALETLLSWSKGKPSPSDYENLWGVGEIATIGGFTGCSDWDVWRADRVPPRSKAMDLACKLSGF
ncbi:Uncharacterised protein [Mycobacteroides abscessus subsp. massiliense]|nr:Uncharacterised protein [Mycobacteroides abscessus subsp. massiliense]